jgi:hypothetical protein
MQKFSLEVENWTEFELVKDFSSLDRAQRYGKERFPQNQWRVFDRTAGAVVFEYDPFATIANEASSELKRFEDTERWRLRFAEQRADEIRARQERERVAERNARRRRAQVEHDRQRRERLQGFGFVGTQPSISIEDDWFEDEDFYENPATEKVNWLKEGF